MTRVAFCLAILALVFAVPHVAEAQSPRSNVSVHPSNTIAPVDGKSEFFNLNRSDFKGLPKVTRSSGNLSEIGLNDFRISIMGGTGGGSIFGPLRASVVYNSTNNQYLVVWPSDDNVGGLVDLEFEIFGQLLTATGAEVGTNDFRISDVGGTGNSQYVALGPSAAYNSTDNQYLVIWTADDPASVVDNEFEAFGQLLDAATGLEVGANDFLISDMGGTGNPEFDVFESPSVAYNSTDNQYLVVWCGIDGGNGPQIYGQRLAATGAEVGTNDFRISDMGLPSSARGGYLPTVAYNSTDNQYLVVWHGTDDVGGLVEDEYEIFGQLLSATGGQLGANDFLISDMGGIGNSSYGASLPSVAYNGADNQYLVVWRGDDNVGGLVDDEREIFGQLLDATGAEVGANDFRLSDMGGAGDISYHPRYPAAVYNGADSQYLVVWESDDNVGGLVNDEYEIFGQILTPAGAEVGANDFLVSDMGGIGNPDYGVFGASCLGGSCVAYNSRDNQYLAVWAGDDNVGGLIDDEYEVFGQRLATVLFYDGFESGDTSAWADTFP